MVGKDTFYDVYLLKSIEISFVFQYVCQPGKKKEKGLGYNQEWETFIWAEYCNPEADSDSSLKCALGKTKKARIIRAKTTNYNKRNFSCWLSSMVWWLVSLLVMFLEVKRFP